MGWIKDILNLFYPSQCHLCGNNLAPHERFICCPCIDSLPRTGYHRQAGNPMEERFAGQFPFVAATGHFFYSRDSSLSQLIQDMKYRHFPSIGNKLGEIAGAELYTSGFLNDIEYIVPLPMHYLKQARRGYNQAERISRGLSEASGIRVVNELKMVRQRKTQTSLSREERINNAVNLFAAKGLEDFNNRGVLLVDDICTTGATMGAAAQVLTASYPQIKLSLFTIGITF